MIQKIASKTFSGQFLHAGKTQTFNQFQALVLAIKNNRIDLLSSIPHSKQDIMKKDEGGKNLLFYAVYQKNQLPFLYLLRAGLPYKQLDSENKNIYHFITYSGSVQCLRTLNFYIKLTNLQKLTEDVVKLLTKYGYKRTDMKGGKLKYSVSPKREALFHQLQIHAQTLYRNYLEQYQKQFFSMLEQKDQIYQRNPIHLGCLNSYQKCLATLQQLFHQIQNPNIYISSNIFANMGSVNSFFSEKIDPRNYQQTLECLSQMVEAGVKEQILRNYDKQFKKRIRQLLNIKDKDDTSPLYIASKNGSTAMINFLQRFCSETRLEQKQQIMKIAQNNLARSLIIDLCQASKIADTVPLNFLISCGDSVNEKKSIFGTFALIQSLKSFGNQKSLQPIKALIKSGADVNTQDTNGWTVLHHAASLGYKQVIELLIQTGKETRLDANKVTNKRYHALHLAGMNEHPQIIKLLIQNPYTKVNIDVADWDGCTALIHAAKKGSLKVLKILLQLNANIYSKDVRDMTALHHAAFTNHPQCIRELLNFDSDYDKLRQMRNSKGKLAKDLCTDSKPFQNVFTASRTGNVNLIRKLTTQNPNLRDSVTKQKQRTPLILAILAKSLISVKFLIDTQADTYHEDKQGKSALNYCEELLGQAKKNKKEQDIKMLQQIKKMLE